MEKEKILNVTAIQMSAEIANKEANFNKVKEIAKRDIKGSTDVIVLPEVWSVGWSPKHFRENAEEISTSQTIEFLSDIARDYKSWVIFLLPRNPRPADQAGARRQRRRLRTDSFAHPPTSADPEAAQRAFCFLFMRTPPLDLPLF